MCTNTCYYGLLVVAWWYLLRTMRAVRRYSFRTALRRARRWSSTNSFISSRETPPTAILRAVERAARYVPNGAELPLVLTGHILCARYGHTTSLRMGVRVGTRDEALLVARAWLETDEGIVLGNVPDLDAYQVLAESRVPAR